MCKMRNLGGISDYCLCIINEFLDYLGKLKGDAAAERLEGFDDADETKSCLAST